MKDGTISNDIPSGFWNIQNKQYKQIIKFDPPQEANYIAISNFQIYSIIYI